MQNASAPVATVNNRTPSNMDFKNPQLEISHPIKSKVGTNLQPSIKPKELKNTPISAMEK